MKYSVNYLECVDDINDSSNGTFMCPSPWNLIINDKPPLLHCIIFTCFSSLRKQ
jgi:hypothetical protein